MRRQTMQPFLIRLIIVVSLILNSLAATQQSGASTAPSPEKRGAGSNPPGKGGTGKSGSPTPSQKPPPPPPPPSPSPPSPPPKPPPSPPPPPPSPSPPSPPPKPPPSPPPPPLMPPPLSRETPRRDVTRKRVGNVVGVLFLGIAGVLQVGVISFLVFKRWQIPRIQDEAGVHLVS